MPVRRVGAFGFIHQFAVTNSMHLQFTYTPHLQYLQSDAHFGIQSNICGGGLFTEIVNVLRPSAISEEKLHRVSLTGFLTEF